jgi:hypothetical protein
MLLLFPGSPIQNFVRRFRYFTLHSEGYLLVTDFHHVHRAPRCAAARKHTPKFFVMLAVAAAGLLALAGGDAVAAPLLAGAKPAAVESHTLLVRDGCGRGMRFSNSRQTCVEDFGEGRGGYDEGPRGYGDRPRGPGYGDGYRDAPRVVVPDCGRGMRYSNSRQACVYID